MELQTWLTDLKDTEFPGIVARPMGSFDGKADYHYQTLRCNVDLLKVVQLGISVYDERGEPPPSTSQSSDSGLDMQNPRKYNSAGQLNTWAFNFKFSLQDDMYCENSIETLRKAGVDFQKLDTDGIDPAEFASLLISSGLVCDEDIHWLSFHGGYDFGYLTKLLVCQPLPDDEREFDMLMKKFFPSTYDIKYLMKQAVRQHSLGHLTPMDPQSAEILAKFEQKGGLDNIAESLKVKRYGLAHQAGSDASLTGRVFFRMRERIFNGEISDEHIGAVWGLNLPDHVAASNYATPTPHHYHHQQENATPSHNSNGYGNAPSTPNTGHIGLVSTPGHNSNGGGIGPLTPGGGGGVFGQFQFGKQ